MLLFLGLAGLCAGLGVLTWRRAPRVPRLSAHLSGPSFLGAGGFGVLAAAVAAEGGGLPTLAVQALLLVGVVVLGAGLVAVVRPPVWLQPSAARREAPVDEAPGERPPRGAA